MGPTWDLTYDRILSKSILGILGWVWTDSASVVLDGRDASRQPRNGVAAHCQLRQLPFQLRGSEADEGCMRENPPLATTGCEKVLCTVATEIFKHHGTCRGTSLRDALEKSTKIMLSNEGR